jgi:N-acyl-L-homoserine lactone synthetase
MEGFEYLSSVIKNRDRVNPVMLDDKLFAPAEKDALIELQDYWNKYHRLPFVPTENSKRLHWYVDTHEPVEVYREELYARRRQLITNSFAEKLTKLTDPAEQFELTRKFLNKTAEMTGAPQTLNMAEALESMIESRSEDSDNRKVSTGLDFMDAASGGLKRTELLALVGRPYTGKTYLFLSMAANAAKKGFKVLFVTLEMTAEEIMERLACIEQNISPNEAKDYTQAQMREMVQESENLQEMIKQNCFYTRYAVPQSSIATLTTDLEIVKPDIIFIDSAYKFRATTFNSKGAGWQNDGALYEDIKRMAMQYKIPAAVSTQFNRELAKLKDCTVEDLQNYISGTDVLLRDVSILLAIDPFFNTRDHVRLLHNLKNRSALLAESHEVPMRIGAPDAFKFEPASELIMKEVERRTTQKEGGSGW